MIRSVSHVGQMESLKKPRLKLRLALQLGFVLLCILVSCGAAPIKKKKQNNLLDLDHDLPLAETDPVEAALTDLSPFVTS